MRHRISHTYKRTNILKTHLLSRLLMLLRAADGRTTGLCRRVLRPSILKGLVRSDPGLEIPEEEHLQELLHEALAKS